MHFRFPPLHDVAPPWSPGWTLSSGRSVFRCRPSRSSVPPCVFFGSHFAVHGERRLSRRSLPSLRSSSPLFSRSSSRFVAFPPFVFASSIFLQLGHVSLNKLGFHCSQVTFHSSRSVFEESRDEENRNAMKWSQKTWYLKVACSHLSQNKFP